MNTNLPNKTSHKIVYCTSYEIASNITPSWASYGVSIVYIMEKDAMRPHVAYIDGLVQEGRNFIANALEVRLSCTNSLM